MNLPKINKKLSPVQAGIIIVALVVVITIIFLLVTYSRGNSSSTVKHFTLNVWGVETSDNFQVLIDAYKAVNPGVTINYTQIPADNYDTTLLNALASGEGPDVFMIDNRSLPRQISRLIPAPATSISLATLENIFPTAVEQDFTSNGQIYALPMYMDTMALLYNKDLFDQAGLVSPPATWAQVEADVPLLTTFNANNQLTQHGAALGGTEANIDHATDILELLMMQNGAQMTDPNLTSATFDNTSATSNTPPGQEALQFYLQFSDPSSNEYTWSPNEEDSLDSFADGNTAMIFDYQSAIPDIAAKSPFLDFGVAPMPQIATSSAINYAGYWGLGLSKQSKVAPADAWDFIIYATSIQAAQIPYLAKSGHPPALRPLIADDLQDPTLGVFARQALTARSWYQADDQQIDNLFNSMLQSILSGQTDATSALGAAQNAVTELMSPGGQSQTL